jgi:putative membrane protein
VDLRVLQANERTLLAWIRTSLAMMAFGFVVARIGVLVHPKAGSAGPALLGAMLVVLGIVCNAGAAVRYARVRRAILERREVHPGSVLVLSVAFALVILGAILVASIAVSQP